MLGGPIRGQPVSDIELYREIISYVMSRCDMIICPTTGGAAGMPIEKRILPVTTFKPELASFNAGSFNFALFHALDKI